MKKQTLKVSALAVVMCLMASGNLFAQTQWDLNGNNNVTDTSFIGSRNNKDLILKTNDEVRMTISNDGS